MQADTGFADALARAGMEGVEEGDAILVQRAAARTAGLEADPGQVVGHAREGGRGDLAEHVVVVDAHDRHVLGHRQPPLPADLQQLHAAHVIRRHDPHRLGQAFEPSAEEVAVFHAFSRIVAEARGSFVVLDTAPTGHTLLLMDAAGAYHRQVTRDLEPGEGKGRIVTPLMRLRDPAHTQVLLVTLPETTPVSEAAALQEDLRRAGIEPHAWIVNRALAGSGATDPLLRRRMAGEDAQVRRLRSGLARRLYLLPWQSRPPVGVEALRALSASR